MLATFMLAQVISTTPIAPVAPPEGATPPVPETSTSTATATATATATKEYGYYGYHPVPDGLGTFCIATGPHKHPFAPFEPALFVSWNGAWVFVGDPYAFGYVGPAHLYWNHHPHPWGGWCYFNDEHHHLYDVWGPHFQVYGTYYIYTGSFAPDYYRAYSRHAPIYRRVRAPVSWGGGPWRAPPVARTGRHQAPPVWHMAPGWRRKRRHP